MKVILTVLIILFSVPLSGQKVLDTIKVYNVYCSYSEGDSYITWGGNWTEFYPAEECPINSKSKYVDNYKNVSSYMSKRSFFWIRLYNTKDQLIYDGLKYSDCRVGKFIYYWPNGRIKLTGEYSGYSYSDKTGYRIKGCSGKKKGSKRSTGT